MRIVFATDLHGNEFQYEQLEYLVDATAADLLILGGDLFAYCREPGPQLAFARGQLKRFLEAVRSRVLWVPGNVDWPDAAECLEEMFAENRRIQRLTLDPLQMSDAIDLIGYPYIPPSPFRIKHWERRDLSTDHATMPDPSYSSTIGNPLQRVPIDFLDSLPSIDEELRGIARATIWVVHTPPFGGNLDTVRGDNAAGIRRGEHVGSKAVSQAIERLQPVLTLHGTYTSSDGLSEAAPSVRNVAITMLEYFPSHTRAKPPCRISLFRSQ